MLTIRMRLVKCWLALSLAGSFLFVCAQSLTPVPQQPASQPASGARHTVSGMVINSITGEPVPRALVRTNGTGSGASFTGQDGRFQLEGVPEGKFVFIAQKPGFFDEASLGRSPRRNLITVGPAAGEIRLKLTPEATIQGRIVNKDGEPIGGLQVQCMMQQSINGRKDWQPRAGTTTNENGVYRFDSLQPGKYTIRTMPHPVFPAHWMNAVNGKNLREIYPARFYADAPDASFAQFIDLQPGQEMQADFTLPTIRSFNVSGRVTGAQNWVGINCVNEDGQQIASGSNFNERTGEFTINQIPAGSWMIQFQSNDGQGHTLFAEQQVTVGAADREGLQVRLQPLSFIPVHVTSSLESPPNVQVRLLSAEKPGNRIFSAYSPSGDTRDSLAFRDVRPGSYKVSAHVIGTGCVDSITAGEVDLTRDNLVVPGGLESQAINVTVTGNCAQLSGKVHFTGEQANAFIILSPDSGSKEPQFTTTADNGNFAFPNVSPGSYRVYAFSDIVDLEYSNPESLGHFPSQQVELAPNQKTRLDLNLIVRGDH